MPMATGTDGTNKREARSEEKQKQNARVPYLMKTPQSRGPSRDAFLSGRPRGMFPKGAYPTDGCIHPSLTVITPKKNQLITAKHYNGGAFFSFLCCTQEKKQVEKRRNANMPGRHLRLIGSAMGNMTMGRKRRHEVLDRLARLGPGLTPAQRNDFVCSRMSGIRSALLHGHECSVA